MNQPLTPEDLKGIKKRFAECIHSEGMWSTDERALKWARTDIPLLLAHIESQARRVEEVEKGGVKLITAIPNKCPITQRPFFMLLEHPDLGTVPTYGGPLDSYTIPHINAKDGTPWHECELFEYRYDHDDGSWVDGVNIVDLRLISEQGALMDFYEQKDELDSLRSQLEGVKGALEFYANRLNYAIPPKGGQTVGQYGSTVQQDHGRTAKAALSAEGGEGEK